MRIFAVTTILLLLPSLACDDAHTTVPGTVISVTSDGTGFTLQPSNNDTPLYFSLVGIELAFPPSHLVDHKLSGAPVEVTYIANDANYIVLQIEDAPVAQ